MSGNSFVDSNIIIYSFMADSEKGAVAGRLLDKGAFTISAQVVGEICNTLKRKAGFSPNELAEVIKELYAEFIVVPVDRNVYLRGLSLLKKYSLSFWDAAILAAALENGCSVVYSEDMQNGLVIENLQIQNPFKKTKDA